MQTILMIGAGKSATFAIDYFLQHAKKNNWQLVLADSNLLAAQQKLNNSPYGKAVQLDVNNKKQRSQLIQQASVVVSMMPPSFHTLILKDCIAHKKHFVNASYVSAEMKELKNEIDAAGIIVCAEMGLDPGIDHMSAMKTIHELEAQNATITSFKSYCGGLVAPVSDTNPWHYKISWNPRNVALAGQGTAQYLHKNKIKFIPYNRLFSTLESIKIEGYGAFEGYANRDSLSYIPLYNLQSCNTFLRGTLRKAPFCDAWNVLVQIGITDDGLMIHNANTMSYVQWFESFLIQKQSEIEWVNILNNYFKTKTIEKKHAAIFKCLAQLGLFSDDTIVFENATSAAILQHLMEQNWKMEADDKDMIVMQHLFEYTLQNKKYLHTASLVVEGNDAIHTAMAKTVSLPLAMATKLILQNKFKQKGIIIPVHKWLYTPILNELKKYNINFTENTKLVK